MKPKPFSALNHFTVPVAIMILLQERSVDTDWSGSLVAVSVVRSGKEQSAPAEAEASKTFDAQQLQRSD